MTILTMVRYGIVYIVNDKHKSTETVNFVKAFVIESAIELIYR